VELEGEHAVADVDEAGARVFPDDAVAIFGGLENLQIGLATLKGSPYGCLGACVSV